MHMQAKVDFRFNLLYKNLKTNRNPKFFYYKNSSVDIFPNDTICQKIAKLLKNFNFLNMEMASKNTLITSIKMIFQNNQ